MRIRLIVAFTVVALLAALAATWFNNLIIPFYGWPSWLGNWMTGPGLLVHVFYKHHRGTMPHPGPLAVIIFFLAAVGLLLAVMTGVAVAASRRVLLPVRRLAQAARRMSDGDLSVRIKPKGRDELAQLTTAFNDMAATLEGKGRQHRSRQPSRRRRAVHVAPAGKPARARPVHAAERGTGSCDALVTLCGPGQDKRAALLRACTTQPHISRPGCGASGPPGSGPSLPWPPWPQRRC